MAIMAMAVMGTDMDMDTEAIMKKRLLLRIFLKNYFQDLISGKFSQSQEKENKNYSFL